MTACNEKEKTPLQLLAGTTLMSSFRDGLLKCCWVGRHIKSLLLLDLKQKYLLSEKEEEHILKCPKNSQLS